MIKNILKLVWVLFTFIILFATMVFVSITGFGKETEYALTEDFIKNVLLDRHRSSTKKQ